jgi:hypothetical protein
MILPDLVDGEAIFLDANILVYHFTPHPVYGPVCGDLVRRVKNQAVLGFTSDADFDRVPGISRFAPA